MKGLVVDSNKKFKFKENLSRPLPIQGEVLVKVKSASVNPFDAESAEGRFDDYFTEYGVDKEVQSGLEFSGVVESDGSKFKRGDKVFGYVNMITGWKTHAEYIAIDENFIALMSENISFSEAAAIPLGALTTLVALQDIGKVKKGDSVLINGAAGGLGVYGVQIAKLMGAYVTAIAGSGNNEFLQANGADKVFDYNTMSINNLDDKFDLILDLTNLLTFDSVKKLLTDKGIFIPAEPNKENGGESEDPQSGYLMVMHGDSDNLTQIANWVSEGLLKAVIDKEFFFKEYEKAISRLDIKGRRGRIVMNW